MPVRQVAASCDSASFHSCGTSLSGTSQTLQSLMAHIPSSGQNGQSQFRFT